METYDLADLAIIQGSHIRSLSFTRAKLMIVSDHGTRLWFIDIEGMSDEELLKQFAESHEIGVEVKTTTIGGRQLAGKGFFHPNPQHLAAAIRGDGQLEGYRQSNG
ncbi:hypothetical protein [Cohnella sp.]|uniref:hypothetical protein n=1 Tax=Cohnella sp. TaxID=1883426 RepID=UPI00356B3EC1